MTDRWSPATAGPSSRSPRPASCSARGCSTAEFVALGASFLLCVLLAVVWTGRRSSIEVQRDIAPPRVQEGERASGVLTVTNVGRRRTPPILAVESFGAVGRDEAGSVAVTLRGVRGIVGLHRLPAPELPAGSLQHRPARRRQRRPAAPGEQLTDLRRAGVAVGPPSAPRGPPAPHRPRAGHRRSTFRQVTDGRIWIPQPAASTRRATTRG